MRSNGIFYLCRSTQAGGSSLSWVGNDRKGKIATYAEFAIHHTLAPNEIKRRALLFQLAGEVHRVSREHFSSEAHFVHAGVIGGCVIALLQEEHAASLGEHLAEDHPGHDRVVRKVALQKPFVSPNGV